MHETSWSLLIGNTDTPLAGFIIVRPGAAQTEAGHDRVVKHGRGLKVSGATQVFLHYGVRELQPEPRLFGNRHVALIDDRLGDAGHQVLPPWHIESMVLH